MDRLKMAHVSAALIPILCLLASACMEVPLLADLEDLVNPPAGDPPISWAKTMGGLVDEDVKACAATSDGGFLIAGSTATYSNGLRDAWAIKVDEQGSSVWEYSFGGAQDEEFVACGESGDGYMFAGWTKSAGAGGSDLLAVRLGPDGSLVWQKTYGLTNDEAIYPGSAAISRSGGAIFGGMTLSTAIFSGDYLIVRINDTGAITYQHYWEDRQYGEKILKLLEAGDGTLLIQKATSNLSADWAYIQRTTSNFGVFAKSASLQMENCCFCSDGGVLTIRKSLLGANLRFVRYDANLAATGSDVTIGSPDWEVPVAVTQASDGGFLAMSFILVAGKSYDILLLRLDASLGLRWMRSYGGTLSDLPVSAAEAEDGGFLVVGTTTSWGGGGKDVWLLRIDAAGNPISTIRPNEPDSEDGEPEVITATPSDITTSYDGSPELIASDWAAIPTRTHAFTVSQY